MAAPMAETMARTMTGQVRNMYAGAPLDRACHRRKDGAWLGAALAAPSSRVLPVWKGHSFVAGPDDAPCAVPTALAGLPDEAARDAILLGVMDETAVFAVDLSAMDEPQGLPGLDGLGRFVDLRSVGPLLSAGDAALCAYARALVWWNQRHRFCGVCGASTAPEEAGHVRRCGNPDCATSHFPRTDPAVIMLVHDGGDRCVLGRQAQWPAGMHSVLAGFVEPGESLEEAVAREVLEEVGLTVTDIHYQSSQPWPFPSSLMLGFTARALDSEIVTHADELESARWIDRATLRTLDGDGHFRLPRRDSIARRLLGDWLAAD
jgi:NAD+ diphosphatase